MIQLIEFWNREPENDVPDIKVGKIDCDNTDCNNCVNHKYCDYEPNKSEIPTGSTTKNDLYVPDINDGDMDCISREQAKSAIRDRFKDLPSRVEINAVLNELPPVTPQEPRWITVSERLPDTDDEVLCWYEYYHWSQKKVLPDYGLGLYLRETSSWFGEVSNGKDVRVIAWMPLPKPYKVESEGKE